MTPRGMYRFLQIVSAINVVLAIVMVGVQASEGAASIEITRTVFFGLGFASMCVAAVRELRAKDAGRPWMVLGGLALLVSSVLFFVGR